MEFWQTFVQFVQQMGFPIAICCYLLYDRRLSDDAHKEEVSKMTDARLLHKWRRNMRY